MSRGPPIDCARPSPREKTLSKSASRARLAEIIRKRSFGRGEITLASGRKSDFYFNLKPTMLDPEGSALLAELTFEALKDDGLDYVGGLEMGAVPLAGAIAQLSWLKGHPIAAFFVRKKPKERLRMISARRAREADLDNGSVLSDFLRVARNLSAVDGTCQRRSRPSTAASLGQTGASAGKPCRSWRL